MKLMILSLLLLIRNVFLFFSGIDGVESLLESDEVSKLVLKDMPKYFDESFCISVESWGTKNVRIEVKILN